MDSRGIVWNIKSRRESGIGSEWQSRDDVDERRRWRGYIKYTTRLREEKLYFLFHLANFGNFIETTIQATGNYYCCWGEKILLRRPVWETGLWMKSANEAESERQRRTGGLNHVWATEKGPRPSTKIVAPSSSSPVFEACGSVMKSPRVVARNRWLAAQREAINFWAYRIRQKRGNRRPRDSLMRILSSFPLKLTRSLFQRLITLQGRWDFREYLSISRLGTRIYIVILI